jgi:hypothetical protein
LVNWGDWISDNAQDIAGYEGQTPDGIEYGTSDDKETGSHEMFFCQCRQAIWIVGFGWFYHESSVTAFQKQVDKNTEARGLLFEVMHQMMMQPLTGEARIMLKARIFDFLNKEEK